MGTGERQGLGRVRAEKWFWVLWSWVLGKAGASLLGARLLGEATEEERVLGSGPWVLGKQERKKNCSFLEPNDLGTRAALNRFSPRNQGRSRLS